MSNLTGGWGPGEHTGELERLLGILRDPMLDSFHFKVRINLSLLRMKSRTDTNLRKEEFVKAILLSSSVSPLNPIGLFSSVLLHTKVLQRRTLEKDCKELHWDSPLLSG